MVFSKEISMYDHIGLKVKDLAKSLAFYKATLGGLGHVQGSSGKDYAGLGPKDSPGLWLYASKEPVRGAHICFSATSRAAVERFHQEGLKAGGTDNGKPGIRKDYSPNYYAAFLIDPDGNNVEAVCYK
jgi:catechol 2,3-dioxygenase-like lactoylglutathione lyase family enzyme